MAWRSTYEMDAMPLKLAEVLGEILDRRARDEADVHTSRVVGRNRDGTTLLQRLDGECTARGGGQSYYPGQVVRHLAGSDFAGLGASGVALLSLRSSSRFLFVESLEPEVFPRGASLTVVVRGVGFTETVEFEFLLPGSEEVNEGITLLSQRLLDSTTMELDLQVAPDAAVFLQASLAYGDPGGGL